MSHTNCHSIKSALAAHLTTHISVEQINDMCVITLPFETIDRRWVEVFVEPRAADYFWIHDGGKAINELILQGMKITPSVERGLPMIASRFGISYSEEMFQTGAKIGDLAAKAYSIGMSSALAMTNLLEHVPMAQEEPLETEIVVLLRRWGKNRAKVTQNAKVNGNIKQHTFDFLVSPKTGQPTGISILNPTNSPLAAAERFGFKASDLAGTEFGKWRRVAIETKAEIWSAEARKIVQRCADFVIPINSSDRPRYEIISQALEKIPA